MTHSPQKIIQQLLIAANQGIDPSVTGDWKVYSHTQPDSGDAIITVFGTAGIPQGKDLRDGVEQMNHGIMVQVRSKDPEAAAVKVQSIADYLTQQVKETGFTYQSATYTLHSFTQTSDVLPLGIEEKNRRSAFSVNGTLKLEEV